MLVRLLTGDEPKQAAALRLFAAGPVKPVYVVSGKAMALVFARKRAAELGPFREGPDKIMETTKIP